MPWRHGARRGGPGEPDPGRVGLRDGAAHAVLTVDGANEVRDRFLAAAGVQDVDGLRAIDAERMVEIQTSVGNEYARAVATRASTVTAAFTAATRPLRRS